MYHTAYLRDLFGPHSALGRGGAFGVRIVDDQQLPVAREMHVELDRVVIELPSEVDGSHRVLGREGLRSAVADPQQ